MDKLNWYHVCLRAFQKYDRTTKAAEHAAQEWLMYEEELIENGQLEEFQRFYVEQTKRDTAEWNRLIAKRERILKQ